MGTRQREKIQPQPDDSSTIDWEKSNYPIINSLNLDGDSASSRCNELQNKKQRSDLQWNGTDFNRRIDYSTSRPSSSERCFGPELCIIEVKSGGGVDRDQSFLHKKFSWNHSIPRLGSNSGVCLMCVYNILYQFFYTFFGSHNIQHCSLRGAEENEIASMLLLLR